MNLVSCNCGVVIDVNKRPFPDDIYADGEGIDETKAVWDGDNFVPVIRCPVCNELILKDLGGE